MAQEKSANPVSYDFPLNQRLLEDALKFKEERRILKERLAKIEAGRSDVADTVFQKVHADYASRLQAVTDQLLEKKQDIDRELATLYETRDKIQFNLKNHKDILEEIQFRHKLGEFTREEFTQKSKGEEDKVKRFEQVLTGVQTNVQRYESLFEGDEDIFGSLHLERPLKTDEEVDEWEQEAEEAQKADSITNRPKEEWLEATKPSLSMMPQITIISGNDNVGKIFPIQGTLTIGRSHTNQIILKDAKVSRQHAEIRLQGNEYILIDLNSSNGTLVNGQKIHEHLLNASDEIQIGDFVMQFQQ